MNKWTKHDWYRFWLHSPVGITGAWLTFENPAVGMSVMALFCFYEYMNDWRKRDSSYKDVIGGVLFYAITALIISLWRLI